MFPLHQSICDALHPHIKDVLVLRTWVFRVFLSLVLYYVLDLLSVLLLEVFFLRILFRTLRLLVFESFEELPVKCWRREEVSGSLPVHFPFVAVEGAREVFARRKRTFFFNVIKRAIGLAAYSKSATICQRIFRLRILQFEHDIFIGFLMVVEGKLGGHIILLVLKNHFLVGLIIIVLIALSNFVGDKLFGHALLNPTTRFVQIFFLMVVISLLFLPNVLHVR